jgi:replicative DNA helicase Mcm
MLMANENSEDEFTSSIPGITTEDIRDFVNSPYYKKKVLVEREQLYISFEELTEFNPMLADYLLENPKNFLVDLKSHTSDIYNVEPAIRLTNFNHKLIMPIRHLRSKHLHTLVAVEGIIRQAGEIQPLVMGRKLECPACGTILTIIEEGEEERTKIGCSCGRRGGFRELSQIFTDQQVIVIEESPDSLESAGQQPKRVYVTLEDSLTDAKFDKRARPGTKVLILGIYKDVLIKSAQGVKRKRKTIIDAINLIPLDEDIDDVAISKEEENKIKVLSREKGILGKFVDSFSTSILGNDHVKRAIILQLLGGSRRKKSDGQFSRDNIHILLLGSRSTGKTVLLNNAYEIMPKARRATGKGASGVGLTASVVKDELTGQYMLESGALPLANRSMLVIDEGDKIEPKDRDYLLEAMETGTLTINKANIQCTLPAQTSILTAANPRGSAFNPHDDIITQINMPITLISRFDCIFVMKDEVKESRDELIADKILNEHTNNFEESELSKDFMKKYILYARKLTPILNSDAIAHIKKFYTSLRKEGVNKGKNVIQIATRQLEGIIRLTEAHAKLRLSDEATKEDSEMAIEVMKSWLREVGYDENTNTFDVNSVTSVNQSKKSKFNYILDIYKRLDKKKMFMSEIEREVNINVIPHEDLYDLLKSMKMLGYFFEPSRGVFHLI